MALQICSVRYLGLFLEDPLDVPWLVVEYLAEQLGISDPSCVKTYVERAKTAYEHSWEIRRRFGYHEFEDRGWGRIARNASNRQARNHSPKTAVALACPMPPKEYGSPNTRANTLVSRPADSSSRPSRRCLG